MEWVKQSKFREARIVANNSVAWCWHPDRLRAAGLSTLTITKSNPDIEVLHLRQTYLLNDRPLIRSLWQHTLFRLEKPMAGPLTDICGSDLATAISGPLATRFCRKV